MGGLASGVVEAGFRVEWASDSDEHAAATFRHRFKNIHFIEDDVRNLDADTHELGGLDLLAAGFPCQSFSQAGDRKGFEDPRGQLFYEIPRLLKEMRPDERPRLLLLENVPYLLYGGRGEWFDAVRKELRGAGYWFRAESCWIANVKDHTSLPQDRERLFMIAASMEHFTHNPFNPSVLNATCSPSKRPLDDFICRIHQAPASEYLNSENRYYKMIAAEMDRGESFSNIYQLRRSYVREKRLSLCPTLTANMGRGGHNVPFILDDWGIRRLSVDEVASLQGFKSGSSLFPAGVPVPEQYRLIGNAACVSLSSLVASGCARILKLSESNAT